MQLNPLLFLCYGKQPNTILYYLSKQNIKENNNYI